MYEYFLSHTCTHTHTHTHTHSLQDLDTQHTLIPEYISVYAVVLSHHMLSAIVDLTVELHYFSAASALVRETLAHFMRSVGTDTKTITTIDIKFQDSFL